MQTKLSRPAVTIIRFDRHGDIVEVIAAPDVERGLIALAERRQLASSTRTVRR